MENITSNVERLPHGIQVTVQDLVNNIKVKAKMANDTINSLIANHAMSYDDVVQDLENSIRNEIVLMLQNRN